MKLLLLALLSSASALTSIRRLVENNADILMQLQNEVDLSCSLSMATDAESCESMSDTTGEDCVWCPFGNEFGGCVSQDTASIVNLFGVPHLHCGPIKASILLQDEEFFSELEACGTGGYNGDACLDMEDSSCQYCVTKDGPTFGICFSEEFVSEAKNLVDIAKQFDTEDDLLVDDMESWDEVFNCDDTDTEALKVGSIADMECVLNGNPEEMFGDVAAQCSKTMDSSGKNCVLANLFGFMDVCVSSTQQTVIDFIQQELNDLGIDDPMSMVMGPAMFGDEVEVAGEFERDADIPVEEYDKVDNLEGDYTASEESNEIEYDSTHILYDDDEVDENTADGDTDNEDYENEDTTYEDTADENTAEEEAAYAEYNTDEESNANAWDEEPGIVVEYEDFIADESQELKNDASPEDVIASMMNIMEERKEAEEESGK